MTYFKTSAELKDLATALSKAQGEFDTAKKDKENPFFKSKYADLNSVREASKKAMADNGLSLINIPDIDPQGKQILIPMLLHSSGQYIQGALDLTAKSMQVITAAMTYGRRGNYGALTGVVAEDEDDDGNLASGTSNSQQAASQAGGVLPPPPVPPAPIPHPQSNDAPKQNSKSAFLTADQRDTWFTSVHRAVDEAKTLEALGKVKDLYKARLTQINSNNHPSDIVMFNKLMDKYEAKWESLIPKAAGPQKLNVDSVMQGKTLLDDEIPF
jgi:hypothetical protein